MCHSASDVRDIPYFAILPCSVLRATTVRMPRGPYDTAGIPKHALHIMVSIVGPEGVQVEFHQTGANSCFHPAPVFEPLQLFTTETMRAQGPDICSLDHPRYDLVELLSALKLKSSAAFDFAYPKGEAASPNERPPSRASAASYGSCDSGLSHPPGQKRRRRKVANMPISNIRQWQLGAHDDL